jgi:hypothetical protein
MDVRPGQTTGTVMGAMFGATTGTMTRSNDPEQRRTRPNTMGQDHGQRDDGQQTTATTNLKPGGPP